MAVQRGRGRLLITFSLVLVLVLAGCTGQTSDKSSNKEEELKVGAILPLTGPASVLGDGYKRGIEAARKKLAKEGIDIEVTYEDSRGKPSQGISAYKKLTEVEDSDVVFSTLSRVSIPLVGQAEKDKIPFLMTSVSAEGATKNKSFAFRFFSKPEDPVKAVFDAGVVESGDRIGILHINDEFGVSTKNSIVDLAEENDVEIAVTESYTGTGQDVKSQLTKIKSANVDKLMIAPTVPVEAVNVVRQYHELGMNATMIELVSGLATGARKKLDNKLTEGIITVAYPAQVDKELDDIVTYYLAYDAFRLLGKATKGEKLSGSKIAQKMRNYGTYDSVYNGRIDVNPNGEINPVRTPVKIVNGSLQRIE